MGLFNKMKDTAKKGLDTARNAQEARGDKKAEKVTEMKAKGILMQLKSAEGMVTLFEDHLEIKNLLGSKVRDIPYTQIEAVYVDKTSKLAKGTAAAMTMGMSLAVTNKKRLIISTGIDKFKIDFRREDVNRIKEVTDFLSSKIKSHYNPSISVNVQGGAGQVPPSAADELEKLAALKAKGILTEEEFTAKKKQILGL